MRQLALAICGLTALAVGAARAEEPVLNLQDVLFDTKANGPPHLFPIEAAKRGLSGRAVVVCVAGKDGTLVACTVQSETPARVGFGFAAWATATHMKLKPRTRAGEPIAGRRVRLPLAFEWEKGAAGIAGPTLPPDLATPPYGVEPPLNYADVAPPPPRTRAYMDIGPPPARGERELPAGYGLALCTVAADGGLRECKPVAEDPTGRGLADAAATAGALAPKLSLQTQSGEPTAGRTALVELTRVR